MAPRNLAIVASGELRGSLLAPNPVVGLSPLDLFRRLQRIQKPRAWTTRIFACVDRPLNASELMIAGAWSFAAVSQFDRLEKCLQHVGSHHHAYLRVRPDLLVLGALPSPLLLRDGSILYAKYRNYYSQHITSGITRDEVVCGACEQSCECATRKYGSRFHFLGHCGVISDSVFLFGRKLLPTMRNVLRAYSTASLDETKAPRAPFDQPEHCAAAGNMVELGFQRLLDDANVTFRPLSLRTALTREMQPRTPSYRSVACILSWGAAPVPCSDACVPSGEGAPLSMTREKERRRATLDYSRPSRSDAAGEVAGDPPWLCAPRRAYTRPHD